MLASKQNRPLLHSVSSHDLWVTKQIICSGGSGSRWKCGIWLSADFTLMLDNNIFYIYTTTKPDSDPRDALCWCQDPWARTRAHALFCFKAPDDDESSLDNGYGHVSNYNLTLTPSNEAINFITSTRALCWTYINITVTLSAVRYKSLKRRLNEGSDSRIRPLIALSHYGTLLNGLWPHGK